MLILITVLFIFVVITCYLAYEFSRAPEIYYYEEDFEMPNLYNVGDLVTDKTEKNEDRKRGNIQNVGQGGEVYTIRCKDGHVKQVKEENLEPPETGQS